MKNFLNFIISSFIIELTLSIFPAVDLQHLAEQCNSPRKKCDTDYNGDNYYAESPLYVPVADASLGTSKLYEPDERLPEGVERRDQCVLCRSKKKPKKVYLDQKLCEPVLKSRLPLPPINIDSECERCSIIHPTSTKHILLHCVGCMKTNGLPTPNGGELLLVVKYLELPSYK